MLVRKTSEVSSLSKFTIITRIWAHDGWCYIPELKQRQRFFITDDHAVFRLDIETWEGVIPRPEHAEELKFTLVSESPLVWQEEAAWGCELFEQTIQNTDTPCHPLLPLALPQPS